MIYGVVSPDRVALVHLRIQNLQGQEEEFEVAVDTGFNGFLTLPPELITRLQLEPGTFTQATLADGTTTQLNVYTAMVLWGNTKQKIEVLEASSDPLLGMSLLEGHELNIQVIDGGSVLIEPLE